MKKKPITEVVEEQIQEEAVEETPVVEPVVKSFVGTATERVNVRSSADLASTVVKVLEKEEEISVSSKKAINGFYPVDGGFVKKEYLKVKEI